MVLVGYFDRVSSGRLMIEGLVRLIPILICQRSVHFLLRIGKWRELKDVQLLAPKATTNRFDLRVISRLALSSEFQPNLGWSMHHR